MSKYSPEEIAQSKAEASRVLELADEMLANRHAPIDDRVIPFSARAPKPPPIEPRLTVVEQMARDTSAQLDEFQKYISNELSELLTTTFNSVADEFDLVRVEMQGLRHKAIETDIAALQAEIATLKSDFASMRSLVELLVEAVASMRDELASVERSGKVVSLRGGP